MNLTPRRRRQQQQQEDHEGGNRTFEDDVIPLNNFLSMMAEEKDFFLANASRQDWTHIVQFVHSIPLAGVSFKVSVQL